MNISITFKTPDAIFSALEEASTNYNLTEDQEYELKTLLSKWIRYGELVTIDFDLENKTAEVREF